MKQELISRKLLEMEPQLDALQKYVVKVESALFVGVPLSQLDQQLEVILKSLKGFFESVSEIRDISLQHKQQEEDNKKDLNQQEDNALREEINRLRRTNADLNTKVSKLVREREELLNPPSKTRKKKK